MNHVCGSPLSRTLMAVAAVCLLSGAISAEEAKEEKEEKAPGQIKFEAQNKGYHAKGEFIKWRFKSVNIPNGDLTKGTVKLEIALASVSEKDPKLADHLRTPDFFDAKKFIKATVEIKDVKPVKDMDYKATATIDFHGVKQDIPVTFTVVSQDPLKIKGKATLQRMDFNIGQPFDAENPRSIENDVQITLTATLPSE